MNVEDFDIMGKVSNLDFDVKEGELNMELVKIPSYIFEAGLILAMTRQRLDDFKRQLELTEAAADTAVRDRPQEFNINGKVTEAAVEAAVIGCEEVKELREKVIQAKHANDVAYAAVSALEAKRKSLESLVQLQSINYYAARNVA